MAEPPNDMISRLELMASGDPKWDLSDNDRAAIAWLVKRGKEAPAPSDPSLDLEAVIAAIDAEPEFPGEPPDEMIAAIMRSRDVAINAMRIAVRQTKDGIRERVRRLRSQGGASQLQNGMQNIPYPNPNPVEPSGINVSVDENIPRFTPPEPGPACPYAGRRYLAIGEILREGDMYPSAASFTGLDPTVQIGFAVDKANWYVRMVEAPVPPVPAPAEALHDMAAYKTTLEGKLAQIHSLAVQANVRGEYVPTDFILKIIEGPAPSHPAAPADVREADPMANPLAWMLKCAEARNTNPKARTVELKFSKATLEMWMDRARAFLALPPAGDRG